MEQGIKSESESNGVVTTTEAAPPETKSGKQFEAQKKQFQEETSKWEAKISNDEWDTEAWKNLVSEVQSRDIEIARDIYERALKQFPTAVNFRKSFIFI